MLNILLSFRLRRADIDIKPIGKDLVTKNRSSSRASSSLSNMQLDDEVFLIEKRATHQETLQIQ